MGRPTKDNFLSGWWSHTIPKTKVNDVIKDMKLRQWVSPKGEI